MDDLRRVDWKATARAQRLIVREFSAEDDKRVTIVFDTRLFGETDKKPLTLREKIDAEQKGKTLSPVSERFEKGVSSAASLLAHFTEEQAEIRLMIDEAVGEFGIGREHLYQSLKRLAMVDPKYDEAAEFSSETLDEIFTERENSYTFFVTSENEENLSSELLQKARILRF